MMSRAPLYSRSGNAATSPPTSGADGQAMFIGQGGGGAIVSSEQTLLEKAQQFSIFAVQHVEEVRQALLNTADGGKNGEDISIAFAELASAYDKLSSLNWDAARMEFEGAQRAQLGLEHPANPKEGAKAEKRVKMMPVTNNTENIVTETRVVKDHPWQGDDTDDDMDPQNWEAFLKAAISSDDDEDEGGDSFPITHGNLASLNATAEPYPATTSSGAIAASTPPGFKSGLAVKNVELNDTNEHNADGSHQTKPTIQSLTSISSEVSSLHTSSHPYDDGSHDDQDSDSEYSDASSSSEELPTDFDYLYKGGYAMQVSGGKETKGVVPKTVKRVLVDPSVKSIEEGAFQGCNVLESITIPSSVEAVGDHAFRKCSKLKTVTFLTKAPSRSRRRKLWNQTRDEKKEESRRAAYKRSASAPPSITEPRSSCLRTIGEWAFFNCSSLVAVDLPYGLESIGTRAFQRCSAMCIPTGLPKTLKNVGENAFVGTPRETKAAFERWEREHAV